MKNRLQRLLLTPVQNIEVYDARGNHKGSMAPETSKIIKSLKRENSIGLTAAGVGLIATVVSALGVIKYEFFVAIAGKFLVAPPFIISSIYIVVVVSFASIIVFANEDAEDDLPQ